MKSLNKKILAGKKLAEKRNQEIKRGLRIKRKRSFTNEDYSKVDEMVWSDD